MLETNTTGHHLRFFLLSKVWILKQKTVPLFGKKVYKQLESDSLMSQCFRSIRVNCSKIQLKKIALVFHGRLIIFRVRFQTFTGNRDTNTPITNKFQTSVVTSYIRIYPHDYNIYPSLRVELMGCTASGDDLPTPSPSEGTFRSSPILEMWVFAWMKKQADDAIGGKSRAGFHQLLRRVCLSLTYYRSLELHVHVTCGCMSRRHRLGAFYNAFRRFTRHFFHNFY